MGDTPTGITDLLPEQWPHGLLWVGVETCWRIRARGKARYTGNISDFELARPEAAVVYVDGEHRAELVDQSGIQSPAGASAA